MPAGYALAEAFVRIRPDVSGFRAEADAKLKAAMAGIAYRLPSVRIKADTAAATRAAVDLRAMLDALTKRVYNAKLNFSSAEAQAQLARFTLTLGAVDKLLDKKRGLTLEGITRAQAELLGLTVAMDKFDQTAGRTALGLDATALAAGRATRGWDSLWRTMGKHIPLAAGLLGSIAVWHVVLDAALELAAVWIPAAVAVAAFGVAGADAATDIFNHMKDLHTVSEATNKAIAPMTGNFLKLQNAIRPAVFQLFGDALTVINSKGSAFAELATGAAKVLENFGARLAIATTKGGAFGVFLENAVPDLKYLGDSLAHFGSILGSLLKALPGYAEILLRLGDAVLAVGARFAALIEPLLRLGLIAHGAIVWGGLLTTVVVKLGPALYGLAVKWIGPLIARIVGLGIAFEAVAKSEGIFAAATALMSRISPLGWVGIAVGALAALVVVLAQSRTATEKFTGSLEDMVHQAQLSQILTTINTAQTTAIGQLIRAQQTLSSTLEHTTLTRTREGRAATLFNEQVVGQIRNVQELTGVQQQLADQFNLVNGRVTSINKTYGEARGSLGLLNAAGITTNQLLDKSAFQWAIIQQQVKATVAAYKAMGATGTTLSNDIEVLDRAADDQTAAIQKLNDAWDQFIGQVTGGQTAFDTFALGVQTLGKNFHSAQSALQTTTHSFQGLKEGSTLAGAAMDGLSQASLTVNQAFAASVVNGNALIDTFRTAGIGGNELHRAVADIIAPMVKFASGSQEATAQLVALAQEAGYKGPVSMQALVKWLGKTHDSTADLKKITDDATVQEALLTSAMKGQADFIANTLLKQLDLSILKYSNVTTDIQNYGKAIAQSGQDSDRTRAARQRLIDDLITTGKRAGESNLAIAGMIHTITGIPVKKALDLVLHAEGSGKMTLAEQLKGQNAQGFLEFHAAGGPVRGRGGPRSDSNLIRASRGEYVVQAKSVNKYGARMMDAINAGKFAGGGMVGGFDLIGSRPVATGQWVVNSENMFVNKMGNFAGLLLKAGAQAAVRQATALAKSQAQKLLSIPGSGALGGDQAANMRLARSMFPWGGQAEWGAFVDLEMREAGFNRFARNPSSGAYGIPQALPPTKMPFAAQAAGGSHAGTQLAWMFNYIRQVYGDPLRADAHERSFHWYDSGGWLPPGVSMAVNRTGRHERVLGPDEAVKVQLHFASTGSSEFDRFMFNWITRSVRTKGGGDVQVAFGTG